MDFEREPYSDALITEMRPLWAAHNREIPQLGLPLDPDLDIYANLSSANALRIYTARIESRLVGYQSFFVVHHPHRKYSLEATQDILYVAPECRRGMLAIQFIRWCDDQLKNEGVRVVAHSIDAHHDFGNVLRHLGYELTDLVYMKVLREV